MEKASIIFTYPFFYERSIVARIEQNKKQEFNNDSLLPYVENMYSFKKESGTSLPFSINVTDNSLKNIIININHKNEKHYLELKVKLKIHFFHKNIAMLIIVIEYPLENSVNNIN